MLSYFQLLLQLHASNFLPKLYSVVFWAKICYELNFFYKRHKYWYSNSNITNK